jgi:hypothetical protein
LVEIVRGELPSAALSESKPEIEPGVVVGEINMVGETNMVKDWLSVAVSVMVAAPESFCA